MKSRIALLLLLALPLLQGWGPRRGWINTAVGNPTSVGTEVSWVADQEEALESGVPSFTLDVTLGEASDIYVEGRYWCELPFDDYFTVDNVGWISDTYGWELVKEYDESSLTLHEIVWEPSTSTLAQFHALGDLYYQFRFRVAGDEVSPWFSTAVLVDDDPSADTTPPTQGGTPVVGGSIYSVPIGPYYGKFLVNGLMPSDAVFGTNVGARIRVDYGSGWMSGSWLYEDWDMGGELCALISGQSVASLISGYGKDFTCQYRMVDGVGNMTPWTSLSDGDMEDFACLWDETVSIVQDMDIKASCLSGPNVTLRVTCYTTPCNMTVSVRGKVGEGSWYEGSSGSVGTFHDIQVFIVGGACTNVDVEYKVGDGVTETGWTSAGQVAVQ